MKERSMVLDSMKGWAVIAVVLVHSGAEELGGIAGKIGIAGARGVQMFFIISALFIFKSLATYYSNGKENKPWKWYMNKFLRLIPLYYISMIAFLLINGLKGNYWTGDKEISALNIISNFLFLNGFNPWSTNAINNSWYIGILAIFIVLAPYLFKKIDNWGKTLLFFGISWLVSIASTYGIARINVGTDSYLWSNYWSNFSIIAQMPVLAIGILLYFLIYQEKIQEKIRIGLEQNKVSVKLLSNVILVCIIWILYENITYGNALMRYAFAFGLLILNQLVNASGILTNKLFACIGKYSYGIYLFHAFVISKIGEMVTRYVQNKYISRCLVILITVAITLVISYVLTEFIEKPILKIVKKERK